MMKLNTRWETPGPHATCEDLQTMSQQKNIVNRKDMIKCTSHRKWSSISSKIHPPWESNIIYCSPLRRKSLGASLVGPKHYINLNLVNMTILLVMRWEQVIDGQTTTSNFVPIQETSLMHLKSSSVSYFAFDDGFSGALIMEMLVPGLLYMKATSVIFNRQNGQSLTLDHWKLSNSNFHYKFLESTPSLKHKTLTMTHYSMGRLVQETRTHCAGLQVMNTLKDGDLSHRVLLYNIQKRVNGGLCKRVIWFSFIATLGQSSTKIIFFVVEHLLY